MMRHSLAGAAIAVLCLMPAACGAQAWLPPRGQGSVSLSYVYTNVDRHIFSQEVDGLPIGDGRVGRSDEGDFGRIYSSTGVLSADYGLWDRIAVSGDVVFVAADYHGIFPESELDTTSPPRTLQDASISLRYGAVRDPLVVTPFASFSFPTHSYETLGHTAVGTRLATFQAGLNLARGLDPVLPNAYVHASYGYSLTEQIHGLRPSFSVLGLEAGYFVTRSVSLRALTAFRWGHNGVDWLDEVSFAAHEHDHDRLAKASYTRLGGGAAWSALRWLDVYVQYETVVAGSNTHDAQSIALGTSVNY